MEVADMRPLAVTPFFTRLGQLFVEGRLEEMTRFWSFPCPVEANGHLTVMHSPEALGDYLALQRADSLKAGLTALTPRISAIEMPRKGRFRVWLRWVFHYGDRAEEEDHGTVFFLTRDSRGSLSIEMMDTVALPPGTASARIA